VELVVVVEAMVLAAVTPFFLNASPPSSLISPGTSLDAPATSGLAYPSSYSPSVATSASGLQPLDLSQPVEDSEDLSQLAIV
jgi:hypothetical protein